MVGWLGHCEVSHKRSHADLNMSMGSCVISHYGVIM